MRPFAAFHGHRSARYAGGGDGPPRGSPRDLHVEPARDRSLGRVHELTHALDNRGLAYSGQDCPCRQICCGHPHDRCACNGDAHREDNRCGHRVAQRYDRNLRHAYGCGLRVWYKRP